MTKQKTILKLEAIIDSLRDSMEVVAHNSVETEIVVDRIIVYQAEYKKITGHYYDFKVVGYI